jgi:protein SCO1/2
MSGASRPFRRLAWAAAALVLATGTPALAEFDRDAALKASQAAIGRQIGDYGLLTQNGERLQLSTLRGRPLVVSMIYTSCKHICEPTTAELRRAVREARATLGQSSFAVLSVSFDTRNDTPERMAQFARTLRIDDPQWYFATADEPTIAVLSKDLGFTYAPAAGGFEHLVQTTLLDDRGRVFRQLYGQTFSGPMLTDPLRRIRIGASPGAADAPGLLERVRLLCTVYDPKSGRYRFDYSLILSVLLGVGCFVLIAVFIGRNWRGAMRAR